MHNTHKGQISATRTAGRAINPCCATGPERRISPYQRRGCSRSGMLESKLRLGNSSMPDANRQHAEDLYYAALDLMAEGKLEDAVTRDRESLEADPTFTEAMHGLARAL